MRAMCFDQTHFFLISPIQFPPYSPPVFQSQLHVLFFIFILASQMPSRNEAGAHESNPCEELLGTGDASEGWLVFFRP